MENPELPDSLQWKKKVLRSFSTKFVLLLFIFLMVPIIIYGQLQSADERQKTLLLQSLQDQGKILAESLRGRLANLNAEKIATLSDELRSFSTNRFRVKLLFQPVKGEKRDTVLYVASMPPISAEYLQTERKELIASGILGRVRDTCEANQALATHHVNPAGEREILTSVIPLKTQAGCWIVLTATSTEEMAGAALDKPYWKSPEILFATVIYLLMALVVASLFFAAWQNVRRFAKQAQDIRNRETNTSFSVLNRIPELDSVAKEFDALVESMQRLADSIYQAAEENAHAFKTPIAVISQSIEPLKRAVADKDANASRALERISRALERLDSLIGTARYLEKTTAMLLDVRKHSLRLDLLLEEIFCGYTQTLLSENVRIHLQLEGPMTVMANEEMIETMVENLLDNAVSFSPAQGTVNGRLSIDGNMARLAIEDEGPGVPDEILPQIFERHFSQRDAAKADDETHFGIGLWTVQRCCEALGGNVRAENLPKRGLRVTLWLPRA